VKITNRNNYSLPLVALLCYDDYDHNSDPNTISATGLLKPIRAIVLAMQNQDLSKEVDVIDLIPSMFGSAIHDYAEKAMLDDHNRKKALDILNVPESAQARIKINPETVSPGDIPFYVEQRNHRELAGFTVSGKKDLAIDGKLTDYKITSCWGFIYDSNSDDYIKQGSIYRWLDPTRVTADHIKIINVFSDWSSARARQGKGYPALRVMETDYPLMSLSDTEAWLKNRLETITACRDLPQSALPECSHDELWASDDQYKYYKKKDAKRATKVYTNASEPEARAASEGGEVRFFPGTVKRCKYCSVVEICDQAKDYLDSGQLEL